MSQCADHPSIAIAQVISHVISVFVLIPQTIHPIRSAHKSTYRPALAPSCLPNPILALAKSSSDIISSSPDLRLHSFIHAFMHSSIHSGEMRDVQQLRPVRPQLRPQLRVRRLACNTSTRQYSPYKTDDRIVVGCCYPMSHAAETRDRAPPRRSGACRPPVYR
jgi:hypothetical protein